MRKMLVALLPLLAAWQVACAAEMEVGLASSMEGVRPRGGCKRVISVPADGLAVRLARNEYESAQILVRARNGGLESVRAVLDGFLVRDDGTTFAAGNVEIDVVGYVNVTNLPRYRIGFTVPTNAAPGYVRKTRRQDDSDLGWWPDPILNFLGAVDVKEGDVQSFWLRVHCPSNQASGVYRGAVTVSARGVASVRIPFSLRVNDFDVGRMPAIPLAIYFGPYSRLNSETMQTAWEKKQYEWVDFLADYLISFNDLYFDPSTHKSTGIRFDILERLKAQGRLGLFNLGYWSYPKSTNDADMAAWREATIPRLQKSYKEVAGHGFLDHAYAYGCDETKSAHFDAMRLAAAELKAALPGVPLFTTAIDDHRLGASPPLDGIDWFTPVICRYKPANAARSRKLGKKVWWYTCFSPSAPYAGFQIQYQPLDARMLMGAQTVRMRPDGFLYWQVAHGWKHNLPIEEGPFTKWDPLSHWARKKDGSTGYNHGDGAWVCVGPGGAPLPTLRLENFRDGLEDCAYAKILESRMEAHADKDDAWYRNARALVSVPREVMDTMTNYTDDPEAIYRWRDAMADAIEAEACGTALDLLMPAPVQIIRGAGTVPAGALDKMETTRGPVPHAPSGVAAESYRIDIGTDGVRITAPDARGERYARTTLRQLQTLSGGNVPVCTIIDWPALKWRGYMNDCGRNYLEMEGVKAILDMMAAYKMNLFHWHLSDYHGWRLESKKYPQLNRPEAFGRQVGRFYSQDDFRAIVRYAAERGITVMPELDVPGHSTAFRKGMGIEKMDTPGVDGVVSELFEELCSLADAKTMPFVHIGTDEVRKKEEMVDASWAGEWARTVDAAGRMPVVWAPGIKMEADSRTVDMVWHDKPEFYGNSVHPFFDAARLYNSCWTPFEIVPRATFLKPCRQDVAEDRKLGAITCTWHDANVGEDTMQLFRESMVFPTIVAMGDNFWCGRAKDDPQSAALMPAPGTGTFAAAEKFERRMVAQRDTVLRDFKLPFPFFAQTAMRWRVRDCETGEILHRNLATGQFCFKTVPYNTLVMGRGELAPKAKGRIAVETWVQTPHDIECNAWIDLSGMDGGYARLRMPCSPKTGTWNRYDARVEVNGRALPPPDWRNPGVSEETVSGIWASPKLEQSLTDEMPALREPYPISLKKGWNHICITTAVGAGEYDMSVASFALFQGPLTHPREVEGLVWKCEP